MLRYKKVRGRLNLVRSFYENAKRSSVSFNVGEEESAQTCYDQAR